MTKCIKSCAHVSGHFILNESFTMPCQRNQHNYSILPFAGNASSTETAINDAVQSCSSSIELANFANSDLQNALSEFNDVSAFT